MAAPAGGTVGAPAHCEGTEPTYDQDSGATKEKQKKNKGKTKENSKTKEKQTGALCVTRERCEALCDGPPGFS